MPAPLRKLALCLLVLPLAASCSGGEERVPTYPARGELFFNSQPAAGAVVILHPKSGGDWPKGYPRAIVQGDGSFALGMYEAEDGAPAGEYVVLVNWPASSADEEATEIEGDGLDDRLGGRYVDPAATQLSASIKEESNDLGRIDLK